MTRGDMAERETRWQYIGGWITVRNFLTCFCPNLSFCIDGFLLTLVWEGLIVCYHPYFFCIFDIGPTLILIPSVVFGVVFWRFQEVRDEINRQWENNSWIFLCRYWIKCLQEKGSKIESNLFFIRKLGRSKKMNFFFIFCLNIETWSKRYNRMNMIIHLEISYEMKILAIHRISTVLGINSAQL